MEFDWRDGEATGKRLSEDLDQMPDAFRSYVHGIGRWTYALREVLPLERVRRPSHNSDSYQTTSLRSWCNDWSGSPLVFAVNLNSYSSSYSTWADQSVGPIWFMPQGTSTPLEHVQAALAVLDVEVETPQPEWVGAMVAPGEAPILEELEELEAKVRTLRGQWDEATARQDAARRYLGLLYEKQRPLEPIVRDALRALGAEVEDPERSDKEEGWVTATTSKGEQHGVLEIKSTRNDTFDEQGLKQLDGWKLDGELQRGIEAKGIFIGNSAIEQPPSRRPWPFDKGWAKAAAKRRYVAVVTTTLYQALALDAAGKLDRDLFWESVFGTDGIFRGDEIAASYAAEFPGDAEILG